MAAEAPNYKHQITNKFQWPKFQLKEERLGNLDLEFGTYLEFGICDLEFQTCLALELIDLKNEGG